MANRLYDKGRNAFARGEINWKVGGDTIRLMLVDSAVYTPVNYATHEFLSDIPVGARAGDLGATGYQDGALMTLHDPVAGVCDADDTTILVVPAGGPYEYVVIYKEGSSANDSQLIALIDSATGLPATTEDTDVVIYWDNGANKILKL